MSAKRYILFPILTLFFCLLAYLLPTLCYHLTAPKVSLCTPLEHTAYTRIPLSGTVIAEDASELTVELPLIASRVLVKVGDEVKAGDTAAIIDRRQSLRAITALISAVGEVKLPDASLSSLLDAYDLRSFDDLEHLIPTRLVLPASGTVIRSDLKENSMLTPGVSCLTVADCDHLSVSLSAAEADVQQICPGDTLYLKSGASGEAVFSAKVTDIAPAASEVLSGSSVKTVVEVKAVLPEHADLKPGYSVYGYRFSSFGAYRLLIPTDAVFQQGETECVYLFENGKARLCPILTDGFSAGMTAVTEGLTPTDIVILSTDDRITDGKRIRQAKEGA